MALGQDTKLSSPLDIGELIRRRRRDMKLTQVALAELSNVSHKFVNEVEHGKPTAEIGKVLVVLQMLGIDLYARTR
ncbi:MAG TPA: type II toxin-antitoxin system Y4mF family antitoxin [Stellaceae bacterium]|nr:type II toxin-antitoxin system Y4mF family antitoxin [Stellaceae bacterium]